MLNAEMLVRGSKLLLSAVVSSEQQLWPASCGTPKLRISEGAKGNRPREPRCLEVRAVSRAGLSEPTTTCEAPFVDTDAGAAESVLEAGDSSAEGCNLQPVQRSSTSGALCLFATLGMLRLRRRFRGV